MTARFPRMIILMAALLFAVLAPAASAATEATDLEKASNLVQPGLVATVTSWTGFVYDPASDVFVSDLIAVDEPFTATRGCTGFFVTPNGHIGSAGHCVDKNEGRIAVIEDLIKTLMKEGKTDLSEEELLESANSWKIYSAEERNKMSPDRIVQAFYGSKDGTVEASTKRPARVLGYQKFAEGDVALMKVDAENTPTLKLGSGLRVGSKVISAGYPGSVDEVTDTSLDASFKDGSISSKKTREEGLFSVYETSAPLSSGMSGGPTVDVQGRVVGINSFLNRDETQSFNFISPVSELKGLMADEGVKAQTGKLTEAYSEGLEAFYAGDRDKALEDLDAALAIDRDHKLARTFRAKAARLPKSGGFPLAALLLIPIGLLGGGAFALKRRRAQTAGANDNEGGAGQPAPGTPSPQPSPRPTSAPQTPITEEFDVEEADTAGQATTVTPITPATPALVGTAGPLEGDRVEVTQATTLGRKDSDVVIDDQQVSRRHAEVRPEADGLVLTDLGSSNGTFVNGRRCSQPTMLAAGDEVEIGSSRLTVQIDVAIDEDATEMRSVPSDLTRPRNIVS